MKNHVSRLLFRVMWADFWASPYAVFRNNKAVTGVVNFFGSIDKLPSKRAGPFI